MTDGAPAAAPPTPRNPALMSATRAYVRAAIELLAAGPKPPREASWLDEHWVRSSVRSWVREVRPRVTWPDLQTRTEELHALPAYVTALAALEADSVIAPQLDQIVGSRLTGMSKIDRQSVLDQIAHGTTTETPFVFDESRFVESYLRSESSLYATAVEIVVIAPTAGLESAPKLRFGEVELDTFSDEEAQALIEAGFLQGMPMGNVSILANTDHVLRLRYTAPRVIGAEALEADQTPRRDVAAEFTEILNAMRLYKGEPISLPGIMTFYRMDRGGSARGFGALAPLPPIYQPTYKLDEPEGAELVALWDQMRDPAVAKREFLGTAARRFTYAGERTRIEDRFVDLIVAAEAMFLGEQEESTTEIAFRISTRFAHFFEIPGTTRRERYEHMKLAYGIRSKIVHGGKRKKLKTPKELEDFTNLTATYLRRCLREMIALAQLWPSRRPLVSWDDLIVGERAPRAM